MSQAVTITPFVASQRDAELPHSGIGWLDAARRDNLDAFLVAGLQTVWVNRAGHDWTHDSHRPHATVGDMQALCALLEPGA